MLISLLVLIVSVSGRAMTPNQTSPRVGDELSLYKLKNSPTWSDTLQLSPNCSGLDFCDIGCMRIWPPSKSDSLSFCVISTWRETVNVMQSGDTLYQCNSITPGRTRIFDFMPEYGIPHTLPMAENIRSHGRTNNIGDFVTRGTWKTSAVRNLQVITTAGDTLADVQCVRSETVDTLIYADTDTSVYKGCVRQWYAPGYRYPLLTHEEGRLFSLAGDSLDHVCNWYATDAAEQRENLKDDYINELVRQSYKYRDAESNNDGKKHVKDNKGSGVVMHDPDRQVLTVSPVSGMDGYGYLAYVLCDISGVVYRSGDMPADGMTISTAGFAPGTYILSISTTSDPIIYKFNRTTP